MAIQPIDLSTMYSQMNNIARNVAHQQQGAQLTQAMQESSLIQQNQEQASQVHKAADNKTDTTQIKKDGSGSSDNPGSQKKRNQKEEEQNVPVIAEIRESYLGTRIDISR